MKKFLSFVLILSMAFSVILTGCQNGEKEDASSSTNKEESKVVVEKEKPKVDENKSGLEPVTLKWYFIGDRQQDDVKLVEEKVNEYLKDKINAKIKLQCFSWGDEYNNRLNAIINSGEEFDICFTAAWANKYSDNVRRKAFVPLNDERKLLETYAPKTSKLLPKGFLAGSEINGLNYAIPTLKEAAEQWGLLFRKDLVEKYNFDVSSVQTLEDLEPMLQVIKENETDIYLEALDGESPQKLIFFDRIGSNDKIPGVVTLDTKDFKVFNEFETEEYANYYRTIYDYNKKGFIYPDAATYSEGFAAFEKAGKAFVATKQVHPGTVAQINNQSGFEWIQVNISDPWITNRQCTGAMQAVSVTSKNPERALMFLELLNTDKTLNNMINYGIEGKHFIKVDERRMKPGPEHDKYKPNTQWMFANMFLSYLTPADADDKWEKYEKFNSISKDATTLGFQWDGSDVSTELAAIEVVRNKYASALEVGAIDPEEYLPKFIKELKEVGVDKVIESKQKQLDAWRKAQGK